MKNNEKLVLKKNTFVLAIVVIILLVLTGGSVYAAVSASQINYTKAGTSVNNVAEALNDLYSKSILSNTGASGNLTTSDTTTINNIELGFQPSKVIIFIPKSTTNITVMYDYDSTVENFNRMVVSGSVGGTYTDDVNIVSMTSNGFTYHAETENTLGKTYWYAIK